MADTSDTEKQDTWWEGGPKRAKMPPRQRLGFIAVTVAAAVFIGGVVWRSLKPDTSTAKPKAKVSRKAYLLTPQHKATGLLIVASDTPQLEDAVTAPGDLLDEINSEISGEYYSYGYDDGDRDNHQLTLNSDSTDFSGDTTYPVLALPYTNKELLKKTPNELNKIIYEALIASKFNDPNKMYVAVVLAQTQHSTKPNFATCDEHMTTPSPIAVLFAGERTIDSPNAACFVTHDQYTNATMKAADRWEDVPTSNQEMINAAFVELFQGQGANVPVYDDPNDIAYVRRSSRDPRTEDGRTTVDKNHRHYLGGLKPDGTGLNVKGYNIAQSPFITNTGEGADYFAREKYQQLRAKGIDLGDEEVTGTYQVSVFGYVHQWKDGAVFIQMSDDLNAKPRIFVLKGSEYEAWKKHDPYEMGTVVGISRVDRKTKIQTVFTENGQINFKHGNEIGFSLLPPRNSVTTTTNAETKASISGFDGSLEMSLGLQH